MIRCIIWDLDGTIANTLPLCVKALKRAIEPLLGRVLSDAEIIDTFGPSEEGTIRALIPNQFERAMHDFLVIYRELHEMCSTPFDGITEILDSAKKRGIRVAMVTGKGKTTTNITLDLYGIRSYFEVIEYGSPLGPRKVEGIKSIIKQFAIAPHECVYVGDAPGDIIASREAGVLAIAAAWADTVKRVRLQSLQPDLLFTSVESFKQYINEVCI